MAGDTLTYDEVKETSEKARLTTPWMLMKHDLVCLPFRKQVAEVVRTTHYIRGGTHWWNIELDDGTDLAVSEHHKVLSIWRDPFCLTV